MSKIDSFFESFVKIALVVFPVLYVFIGSFLAQNSYEKVEVIRKSRQGDSFYYKENKQISLKGEQAKLKCTYKEKDGKQIMACYEVY